MRCIVTYPLLALELRLHFGYCKTWDILNIAGIVYLAKILGIYLDIGVAKIYPKVAQIVTLNVELYWTNTSHVDGILSVGRRHLHFCVWLFSFYKITALLVGGGQ